MGSLIMGCNKKDEIIGNWSFCENEEYNEVFINDTLFNFYFNEIGFSPMLYDIKDNGTLSLFDSSKKLKLTGEISRKNRNNIILNLVEIETNKELVLNLNRFPGDYPLSNSSNIDEYYDWLQKKFIPDYEARKLVFKCPHNE